MQTDATRQSFSAIIIQFIVLAALFWASSYYGSFDAAGSSITAAGFTAGTYLPGNYISAFTSGYPTATVIVSLLLLFVNAFLITKTVSRNLVYATRTYLPCIFYILVASGVCFPAYDLAAVIAAYLIVHASIAFISSFVRTVSFGSTFKGAFFIGLTPLLEPQNAIYILLVPAAMLVFRRGGRETIVAVLGSLLPALITAYIWWASGKDFTGIYTQIWCEFTAGIPNLFNGEPYGLTTAVSGLLSSATGILKLTGVALIIITIILSLLSFFTMSSDMRTRAYKIHIFAIWFLLLSVISLLLPSSCCGNFPVAAIPAAILIPSFFVKHRSLGPMLLYILIIATITTASLLRITAEI